MNPIALISIFAVLTSAAIIKFANPQNLIQRFSAQNTASQVIAKPLPAPTDTPTPTPLPTASPSTSLRTGPSATPSPSPITVLPSPVKTAQAVSGGFSYQRVSAEGQTYNVSIVAADLNSTKVIVDTASDSDCGNECPVLSLAEFVARNGAWAGINGSYFCPADYPSCAAKKNSFDTLLMNKNKLYFNSDNNVYSQVPAAIFSAGSVRFVGQTLEWGRDTGPDSVIANYPLLVAGGNINFSEAPNEPKFGGKAARTFIAAKGNMVYIGIVHSASMGESAKVLKAMGMDAALNLDQGGSTALWHAGYKAGPGRRIPNAILFVNR